MLRPRSVAATTVAWIVGAVLSVAIGLIALSMIGTDFAEGPLQPASPNALSQTEDQPPAAPAASTPPSAGASASSPAPAVDRTVTTRGGTVVARCLPSGAYLVGWSPTPGYRADDVSRGPAARVVIHFEGTSMEITVSMQCRENTVEPTIREETVSGIDH